MGKSKSNKAKKPKGKKEKSISVDHKPENANTGSPKESVQEKFDRARNTIKNRKGERPVVAASKKSFPKNLNQKTKAIITATSKEEQVINENAVMREPIITADSSKDNQSA